MALVALGGHGVMVLNFKLMHPILGLGALVFSELWWLRKLDGSNYGFVAMEFYCEISLLVGES